MKRKRLGDVLRERRELSAESLQKLFDEQHDKVIRLGELILERGLVEKSVLTQALEEVSGIPYLDCSSVECDPDALQMIPAEIAQRLTVLPIGNENLKLIVAMAEPQNLVVLDELRFISNKTISPRFGFVAEIIQGVKRNYGAAGAAVSSGSSQADANLFPEIRFVSTSTRQANREAIQEVQEELSQKKTSGVHLVSEIIQQAIAKQASDIHIEPQSEATVVRIRVDGVLRELQKVPRTIQNSLVSRIKILSGMDIGERRSPQDGRFTVAVGPHELDLRVSSLPTQYGEKIVIRLLPDRQRPVQRKRYDLRRKKLR
jgi:type IV pilus assembly protein PilB